ncbi:MAG: peptide-N4-asparagine amidase [Acidobacteriaceae bacterium]
MNKARPKLTISLLLAILATLAATAQTTPETPLHLGSKLVASAEPPVARPSTTPCAVTLLHHEAFDHRGNGAAYTAYPHPFHFAPPQNCPGPWAKVVLDVSFSIPAGRQYDRTVALWLGGVNLYFATTMEPEPGQPQHWRIARDLTDYSALFLHPHPGQIILNNLISPTTNQPIYVTARLLFYPLAHNQPAPRVPDQVLPLSNDPAGAQQALDTPNQTLSRTFTFPRNITRAYLDVIAQSQAHDERWYTCVDKQYLARTRDYSLEAFEACDGGSLRAVEVLIDNHPAGLAPVYPWIFAGGIEPHLWLPTPAIQTTNFLPFRVDLSPFAALLDNGHPHTVAVRVLGADHFFNVAANLLILRDQHAARLHGKLIQDTLSPNQPAGLTVQSTLHPNSAGQTIGTLNTRMTQSYLIRGQLQTPQGNRITTVRYTQNFLNLQTFTRPGPKQFNETIRQNTTVSLHVTRTLNGKPQSTLTLTQTDPLSLDSRKTMITNGQNFTARIAVHQGHEITLRTTSASGRPYHAHLTESLTTRDRACGKTIPPPLDRTTFHHQQSGQESVTFRDSLGSCYQATIASHHERLTAIHEGAGCPSHHNQIRSHSRPGHPWLLPLQP